MNGIQHCWLHSEFKATPGYMRGGVGVGRAFKISFLKELNGVNLPEQTSVV